MHVRYEEMFLRVLVFILEAAGDFEKLFLKSRKRTAWILLYPDGYSGFFSCVSWFILQVILFLFLQLTFRPCILTCILACALFNQENKFSTEKNNVKNLYYCMLLSIKYKISS